MWSLSGVTGTRSSVVRLLVAIGVVGTKVVSTTTESHGAAAPDRRAFDLRGRKR